MFKIFPKRLLISNSNAVGGLQFLRFNTTLQNRTRAKEIRNVKLIGTISQEPFAMQDGAKLLTIKTVQPDSHYKLHRVVVRSPKILEIVGNGLTTGQRVYVSGELQAQTFTNNENKVRQSFQVKANELYASKAETSSTNDLNNVCILSYVSSDIIHLDQYSVFHLCGHFVQKNTMDGSESERVQFYKVYVHDKDLVQLLKNSVQKRDRVLVNGFLGAKPETDQNGQRKYAGHVEATQILKVDRFSEAQSENTAEDEIKTTNE